MKVNYVLMYGTPYLRYKEFETFEDVSKFLVNKSIVNYSIFKKLDDKEEIEMIYRDNDIHYLENIIKEVREKVKGVKKINNEVYEQTDMLERFYSRKWCNDEMDSFLEILDKENK